MKTSFLREAIADSVFFGSIKDSRYKTNLLALHLILPIKAETMTENALVSLILEKGYADYPTLKDFSKKLNLMYGASVAGNVSKAGDNAVITLLVSAIDDSYAINGEELLKMSAEILSGMLLRPNIKDGLFDEKTFNLQREYLIDTIKAEINNKRKYAQKKTVSLMFKGEAYGENKYGTIENAEKITLKEVTEAYYRILDEATIEIMHVGMGSPEAAKEIFRDAFAKIKRHPLKPLDTKVEGYSGEVNSESENFDVTQSKLCLGFKTGISPASELINPMRMAVAILGGTPTSKLFINVREKKSLCYYCAARFDRTKGIMLIDSGVEHDKISEAKEAILEQLSDVCNGDFTDTDMEFALLSLKNSFNSIGESVYSVENYYFTQTLLGLENTPKKECEALSKVTKEEIVKAAKMLKLHTVYLLTNKKGG